MTNPVNSDAALVRNWLEANKPSLHDEHGIGAFEEAWAAAVRLSAVAERADELTDALQRIYWLGAQGEAEEIIIEVLTPEERVEWAKAHAR